VNDNISALFIIQNAIEQTAVSSRSPVHLPCLAATPGGAYLYPLFSPPAALCSALSAKSLLYKKTGNRPYRCIIDRLQDARICQSRKRYTFIDLDPAYWFVRRPTDRPWDAIIFKHCFHSIAVAFANASLPSFATEVPEHTPTSAAATFFPHDLIESCPMCRSHLNPY
jgi:hypothetical protein